MRKRRIVEGVPHYTEIYGVPCIEPDKHKDATKTKEWGDECVICFLQWYEALPWVRSFVDDLSYKDDEALMGLLRITEEARKKKRLSVVYRNCWGDQDANHQNYICELFGIETGESKNPDSYPYWRLTQKANPNMIIPIFRERICFEPQIKECPIYLEIIHLGYHREITMRGLDSVEDLSWSDLKPLLRVREWLLDKDSTDNPELFGTIRKPRGGDHSPEWRKELWSNDNLRQFATMVKDLTSKWGWIKSQEYDPHFFSSQEWVNALRERPDFVALFSNYRELTDDLLLRITDKSLRAADRQPLALACVHAAQEFKIIDKYKTNAAKPPSAETLRNKYEQGVSLLPSDPTKQS